MHVLRFSVADAAYAVRIERVVEIAPRVAITPLPDTPPFVEGVFSFRRAVCVAISLRRRLGHAARRPALDEHIVVVNGRRRVLGLVVDRVSGDEHVEDARVEAPAAETPVIEGLVALPSGVLLIHDVDALLTDREEASLDASLSG
ncbi:MAG: chemotaxis protein CheW [Labilithrix sp.]|nr:chemotaxis protein CheW [Labilithrix sp.]MCW5817472.1 chemotaxis protein CheW [Labilithrix sp.]